MNLMEQAAAVIERGWSFTPLNGKMPILDGWQNARPAMMEDIEDWIASGKNLGLRTGSPSGVLVVDVDGPCDLDFPVTIEAATGGGGRHLYFEHVPGIRNSVSKLAPKVDIRSDGGQVVFPGSVHPVTGEQYRWADGRSPAEVGLAKLPEEYIQILKAVKVHQRTRPTAPMSVGGGGTGYGKTALRGECNAVASCSEGSRNHTLCRSSFKVGQLIASGSVGIDLREAEQALYAAADACGLVSDDGDRSVMGTIASGLKGGMDAPRSVELKSLAVPPPPPPPPVAVATAPPPSSPVEDEDSVTSEFVFIPGQHVDQDSTTRFVGNHEFLDDVAHQIPPGTLYARGGMIGELQGSAGGRTFIEVGSEVMRCVVDRHMTLCERKLVKEGKEYVPVFRQKACSKDLGAMLRDNLPRTETAQQLDRISPYPVYDRNWERAPRGWRDGIFYDEPDELLGLEPVRNVDAIRETLNDLVVDFPFADEASRQNFFGMMLTPIVQPAVRSNRPIHCVMASLERTGKSKLVESVFGGVLMGGELPSLQHADRDEETDKRIMGLLKSGATVVNLDNLKQMIDSAPLASLLTAANYQGRVLGTSNMATFPNNLTLVGTGNNVEASGEIAKRMVLIMLQPQTDSPESRTDFEHPDLVRYVRQVRMQVMGCLLGMVENWKSAGMPRSSMRMGGFDDWSTTIGGILGLHGFDDWMGNWQSWRESASPEQADLRALVSHWHETQGSTPQFAKELLAMVEQLDIFPEVLGRPSLQGKIVAFGRRVLQKAVNQPVGDLVIRRQGSGNTSLYYLRKKDAPDE